MSARFVANFVTLILGAGLAIAVFAFSAVTAKWLGLGVGVAVAILALYSFASVNQGIYQRIADVVMCALGAWTIVAAVVMNDRSMWLLFGGAGGMAVLGALGLLVRELELGRGLQVGRTHISTDEFAYISAIQRNSETHR